MRYKQIIIHTIILIFFLNTNTNAQNLYLKEKNSIQTTSYNLNNIQKICFLQELSTKLLCITKTDNSCNYYSLSNLQYLSFKDYITKILSNKYIDSQNITLYPNPATNSINICIKEDFNKFILINILNFEGKVVKTMNIKGKDFFTIDISQLENGIYICQYVSNNESKSIKFIKS